MKFFVHFYAIYQNIEIIQRKNSKKTIRKMKFFSSQIAIAKKHIICNINLIEPDFMTN